jgi:hypothetical protein
MPLPKYWGHVHTCPKWHHNRWDSLGVSIMQPMYSSPGNMRHKECKTCDKREKCPGPIRYALQGPAR